MLMDAESSKKCCNFSQDLIFCFLWEEIFNKMLAQDFISGKNVPSGPNVRPTFDLLTARKNLVWRRRDFLLQTPLINNRPLRALITVLNVARLL